MAVSTDEYALKHSEPGCGSAAFILYRHRHSASPATPVLGSKTTQMKQPLLSSFIVIRLSCIFPFGNSTNSLQGLEGINLRILHDDAVHVADRLEGHLRRRPSVIARVNIACAYGTLLCVRVRMASCFIVTR